MDYKSMQLYSIHCSHYVEKVRWALHRYGHPFKEHAHVPVFHMPFVKAAGGRRQVPLLVVDGTPIEDSTAILQYLDGLLPTPSLYPADLKEDISRWEHTLNKKLGSLARKLIYSHRLATPSLDKALMAEAPVVERMLYAVGAKYLVWTLIRNAFNARAETIPATEQALMQVFQQVDDALSDGRRYLLGSTFTAADLTFAALGAPVILLAEDNYPQPTYPCIPSSEDIPDKMLDFVTRLRQRPSGQFLIRLYKEDRRVVVSRDEADQVQSKL